MKRTDPLPEQPLVNPGSRSFLAGRFIDLVADKLVATEAVFRHHLDSDVPFIHMAGEYISQG
ncbi:MAG TPA: hypothetical protein VIJ61_02130, partial [Thermoanaerobaculia bacterium]